MHRRALSCRNSLAIPALASILTLATLSATASAKPPQVVVPKGLQGAPGQPALSAPLAGVPAPPPIVVNDPLLTPVPPAPHILGNWKEALSFIMARSTTLATAVQEVVRAEGNSRIALAAALPTITGAVTVTGQLVTGSIPASPGLTYMGATLLPGGTATTIPPVNPTVLASIQAIQPILAPRAWYGIKTGEMGVTSAKLSVDDQKRTIFTGVASSIITVFTAERAAETNRVGLKSALELVDLTERQFKLGTATRLDVLRAQQNAATARATLVSGDEALRQAREALGLALGFNDAYGVPPSLSLNEIETTLQGICAPSPLDERADIKKAKNDIEIAKRGITDVWLQFSPTATLSTTAGIANTQQATSDHIGAWNIVGVLTVPFWDGGLRYGNLKVAKAQAEETKITLEAALRTANIQIAQALRSVSVAENERVVSENGRDLARDLAKLTLQSYTLGTATNFDLVNTEQVWRAAELDLIVKEFAVIQAKLAAVLATSNCTY
jgi:outer membrane protein, multidrug efflux system